MEQNEHPTTEGLLHRIRWANVICGLALMIAVAALALGPPRRQIGSSSQAPVRPAGEAASLTTPVLGRARLRETEPTPISSRRRSHARKRPRPPHPPTVTRTQQSPAPAYVAPEPETGVADLEP